MRSEKLLNATEAAKYLGVSRQRFYIVKLKHAITEHFERKKTIPRYAVEDLRKVKIKLDRWKAAHAKRVPNNANS